MLGGDDVLLRCNMQPEYSGENRNVPLHLRLCGFPWTLLGSCPHAALAQVAILLKAAPHGLWRRDNGGQAGVGMVACTEVGSGCPAVAAEQVSLLDV